MALQATRPTLVLLALIVALPVSSPAWSDSETRAISDGFLNFPGIAPIPIPPRDGTSDASGARPAGSLGSSDSIDGARRGRAVQAPPKPLTPDQKSDLIRKALAPRPPPAMLRRQTLDDLYAKLAASRDTDEAEGLAGLIGSIWMRSDSDTANLLMQRAVTAIEAKNYDLALEVLDRLVVVTPNWPEAWNKRASVRFFAGDLDGSMADVDHVLKLEPRHFGALDGMATILQRTGFDKRALEVYRRALAIYPHQTSVESIVEKLTLSVEGQGI